MIFGVHDSPTERTFERDIREISTRSLIRERNGKSVVDLKIW